MAGPEEAIQRARKAGPEGVTRRARKGGPGGHDPAVQGEWGLEGRPGVPGKGPSRPASQGPAVGRGPDTGETGEAAEGALRLEPGAPS